jgi:hypothetical protein
MKKEDLRRIIREGFESSNISESDKSSKRYMFMSNLEQMCRQAELLMQEDSDTIDQILDDGHDWAADHVATAKESLDQVFDFLMNKLNKNNSDSENDFDDDEEYEVDEEEFEDESLDEIRGLGSGIERTAGNRGHREEGGHHSPTYKP